MSDVWEKNELTLAIEDDAWKADLLERMRDTTDDILVDRNRVEVVWAPVDEDDPKLRYSKRAILKWLSDNNISNRIITSHPSKKDIVNFAYSQSRKK